MRAGTRPGLGTGVRIGPGAEPLPGAWARVISNAITKPMAPTILSNMLFLCDFQLSNMKTLPGKHNVSTMPEYG